MKKAFTLSEVLITLGIIGIISALTLPIIIQKYNNHVVETGLKKFYSTFNQAIIQSINENGTPDTWDYWGADGTGVVNNKIYGLKSMQKYILPYLNVIDIKDVKNRKLYILEDGSSFSTLETENREIIFYPKNGEKCMLKNEADIYGVCAFVFNFFPRAVRQVNDWRFLNNKGMEPFLYYWNGNENNLYESTKYGCKNGSPSGFPINIKGAYCTAIIQRNGWKIPAQYPRKIKF